MAHLDFENTLSKIRPHTTSKQLHQRKPALLLVALESTLDENSKASTSIDRRSPTAYFASLLTTLEGVLGNGDTNLEDGATLPAILYLLALIIPFAPPIVLRTNLPKTFQLLPPLLPISTDSHAPPLRSLLSILGASIMVMDQSQVLATVALAGNSTGTSATVRNTYATFLELVLDRRPKVRRKAGETVKMILESPPSPLATHPWASLVAEWGCNVVALRASEGTRETVDDLIHLIAFLRTVPFVFSASPASGKTGVSDSRSIETMTKYLLAIPKLSNPYLSQASYQLLTALLATDDDEDEESDEEDPYIERRRQQISTVLSTLLSGAPAKTDAQLGPYWLTAVAQATVASKPTSRRSSANLNSIWNVMWQYLDSNAPSSVRESAKDALQLIVEEGCFDEDSLRGTGESPKVADFSKIVELITKSLSQITYAGSMKEIIDISTAFAHQSSLLNPTTTVDLRNGIRAIYQQIGRSHPLISMLGSIMKLRGTTGFEYKESADRFFSAMMGAVGVDVVIQHVPLRLLPSERASSSVQPNAYLLPLIPTHHPTPLSHFVSYFIPLSESLWELAEKSEKDGEKKVYKVLMEQIWNAFPSYCRNCWDLQESFTPQLAERLTQVLYHAPNLRPAILRGLKSIVDASTSIIVSEEERAEDIVSDLQEDQEDGGASVDVEQGESSADIGSNGDEAKNEKAAVEYRPLTTPDQARENIKYLNSQAKSWLAVLFNVFTSMEKDSRGMVGSVISAWAGIANEPELAGAYRNVLSHLKQNLSSTSKATGRGHLTPEIQKNIATLNQMLDILLLLVPHLPAAQLREVVALFKEQDILGHPEGSIQKLGYRVLNRVVSSIMDKPTGFSEVERVEHVETVLQVIGDGTNVAAGATKERLSLLSTLVEILPSESLHYLVAFLMEPIMGVKEHSEKVRLAAFDLLVVMGNRMRQGGTIDMSRMEGAANPTEDSLSRDASVEEFVRMVGASLAADRDHTISAGIMSLSRVIFEFRAELSEELQTEIVSTVYPLLAAKNREIVKSVIGFVKLTIHALSPSIVQPQLATLVPALLTCLTTHRHHFKVNIRHLFERLVRKYGIDEIERYAMESGDEYEGALKMITNIKKRKERAARKKAQRTEGDDGSDEEPTQRKPAGDAFEDVLYGSDSDGDDSNEEGESKKASATQGSGKVRKSKARPSNETRLRVDDDEPMDLLDGAAGRLITTSRKSQRKPGQEASKFRLDEDTGRMIIQESDSDEDLTAKKRSSRGQQASVEDQLAGAAYKDTLVSVDGFTRNPNGTIKFHKDTKKRRKEEMEMGDMDVDATESASKGGVGPERTKKRKEARLGQEFKAKRAGGDVKRNGVDPYAYLTLGQAAGGRKGKGKAKVSILGKR